MSANDRVYNFSAGPGVLPVEVLEQAQSEMLNWHGAGMSVMEMSHRSKPFDQIIAEAEADCRSLMGIPDNYKVLFLQGGASLQFTMLAMNFLQGGKADYVTTGSWGQKAIKSAAHHGLANEVFNGKSTNFDRTPDLSSLEYDSDARYIHITLNETIQGVDYLEDPNLNKPVICDMSSCIASRKFDVSKYSMIYAGAQKNLGPAGMTLVIIQDEFFETAGEDLPEMLSYRVQAENDSRFNTPPCWSIYMSGLVFKHWLSKGGLDAVQEVNEKKAGMLYDAIDNSGGFYKGHAVESSRSRMNIPFVLPSDELTDQFLSEAKANGMVDLKGHRSVGGCRASIYNAFPMEGVEALVQFMADFRFKNS